MRVQKALCNDLDELSTDAAIARSIEAFAGMFAGDEPARMMNTFLARKGK